MITPMNKDQRYHLSLDGDLGPEALNRLQAGLEGLPSDAHLHLDLSDCDVDGSEALIEAIDLIRGAARRGVRVTLFQAPQLLAHGLYRIGALPTLTLVEPREEEPYG